MKPGVIWGVVLIGLGLTMVFTSEGHNVGYITTILGVVRIIRSVT